MPTLGKLLIKVKGEVDFPWSKETLGTIFKKNKFSWGKCQLFVYLNETWINNNDLHVAKCWQSYNILGVS